MSLISKTENGQVDTHAQNKVKQVRAENTNQDNFIQNGFQTWACIEDGIWEKP